MFRSSGKNISPSQVRSIERTTRSDTGNSIDPNLHSSGRRRDIFRRYRPDAREDPRDIQRFSEISRRILRFPNPRLDALKEFLEENEGKAILWCRYHEDIFNLQKAFGDRAVDYYGGTKDKDRKANKSRFIEDPDCDYIIATTGRWRKG